MLVLGQRGVKYVKTPNRFETETKFKFRLELET